MEIKPDNTIPTQLPASETAADEDDSPLVSLIVLTYNRLEYLKETLESALAQTYPNLEIIVSDNHSEINPQTLVESYNDPRVRFYRNPTNVGQTANYVVSVKKAQGKYVAFLHDDDKYEPEFISTMVAAMEADPEIVLAFSDIFLIDHKSHLLPASSEQATSTFKQNLTPGKHKPFYRDGLVDRTISGMDTVFLRTAIDWNDLPIELPACADLYLVYLFALTNQATFYNPRRLCLNRVHPGQQTITTAFPRGMVMCYQQFLTDKRLKAYHPDLKKVLAVAQVTLAVALIKEGKAREARYFLKESLRYRISLRGVTGFGLSYLPPPLVNPVVAFYKRGKRILKIKSGLEFTS